MKLDALKAKSQPSTNRAGRLHQINRFAIAPQDRNISLSQQIAHLHHGLDMRGHEAGAGKGLTEQQIQERICATCGDVEGVYRGKRPPTHPPIGSCPMRLSSGNRAAYLGCCTVPATHHAKFSRVCETDALFVQIEDTAIA